MDQRLYSREKNAIQKQEAFNCAQVLAGVKASNILITTEGTEEDVAFVLRGTGVDCKCLWAGEGRTVYLLYRREQMEKLLKSRETRSFFQSIRGETFSFPDTGRCTGSRRKTENVSQFTRRSESGW